MSHKRVEIRVSEGDAPLLTLRFRRRLPSGLTAPYPLSGSPTVKFIVKADADTADSAKDFEKTTTDGVTITVDGSGANDEYSEITIQLSTANVGTPTQRYFKVVVQKASQTDTTMSGRFITENT